jgi:hypothetical protein
MPFSVEADVPPTWECKVCGATALLVDGAPPEEKAGKPARTHWDMLMERRTVADLEEVLAERLAVLRDGGIANSDVARPAPARTVAGRAKRAAGAAKASSVKTPAAPAGKPKTTASRAGARKAAAHTSE